MTTDQRAELRRLAEDTKAINLKNVRPGTRPSDYKPAACIVEAERLLALLDALDAAERVKNESDYQPPTTGELGL